MAAQLLDNRNRAIGLAAAVVLHGVVIALLVLLGTGTPLIPRAHDQFVAIALHEPPPPPPPDKAEEGAAAPPSQGRTKAPTPPLPPRPLPSPVLAAAGAGTTPGTGSGQGGAGVGSGSGGAGTGTGSGAVTPPQRIAGQLTNADYRQARAPEGAQGTVVVEFDVGTDGTVERCGMVRSSGYGAFDEATCRLIRQRFRYRPARDGTGRAVEWTIRTDYIWAPH